MATPTYTALATTTLATSATDVTFSSIPTSGYRDLILVINGTLTSSAESIVVQVGNGTISTSGYSFVYVVNTISGTASPSFGLAGHANSTEISTSITQFFDYSATDKHKTWLGRRGPTNSFAGMDASRWASTVAIDIMKVFPENYAFAAGTTLSLYGIEA